MLFMPQDAATAASARQVLSETLTGRGLDLIGWREVPVDPSVLGHIAATTQPQIEQLMIRKPADADAAVPSDACGLPEATLSRGEPMAL